MRHRISFYLTYACIVLFGSIGALLLLLGEKTPRASEAENRMLAGFPPLSAQTLADGSFMSGLESYLSDGMPGRDRIVTDTAVWMNALALNRSAASEEDVFAAIEDISFEGGSTELPDLTAPPTETPSPISAEAPTAQVDAETQVSPAPTAAPTDAPTATPDVPVEDCHLRRTQKNGKVQIKQTFKKKNVQNAINVLNAYRAALPEDGRLFFTQSPFASTALTMQSGDYTDWDCDLEETLAAHTLPGVEIVSTIDVLQEPLQKGEDLYFKTDHHWKPRAACYLAQAMLARLGIHAPDYDTYSYRRYHSFYGSVVKIHPERKGSLKPDSIDVLVPNLPVTGCKIAWDRTETPCPYMRDVGTYEAYMGGTSGPWRRYETGVDSGRKCLILGDSFTIVFLPYLTPFYEEVHYANYRPSNYRVGKIAWGASDYIRENGIDDVFIVVCTEDDINSPFWLEWMPQYL